MEVISVALPADVFLFKGATDQVSKGCCSGDFLFLFVRTGVFRLQIDGSAVVGTDGELIIAVVKESYQVLRGPHKSVSYLVLVRRHFIIETKMFYHFIEAYLSRTPVKLFPDRHDSKVIVRVLKLLHYSYQSRNNTQRFSRQSFNAMLSVLVFQSGWYYNHSHGIGERAYNRKELLTLGFFKLLLNYFTQERSLDFYAGILCVSKDYLSKAVKQVSGKTVSECIAEIIISESKYLLIHQQDTIETISEKLSFSSPGSFSRFFKKHVGLGPTAYRRVISRPY